MLTFPQNRDVVQKNQSNHKKTFQSRVNRPLTKRCMGEALQGSPNGRKVPIFHVYSTSLEYIFAPGGNREQDMISETSVKSFIINFFVVQVLFMNSLKFYQFY